MSLLGRGPKADTLQAGAGVGGVDELQSRLALLDDVVEGGAGRIDGTVLARTSELRTSARSRLGHGTSHTVVALAGATGSGKSSLFNAVSGTEFATVGVRRPTTSQALAVVFGDGADALLDWLAIPQRQRVASGHAESLAGLVLVDLPDHDSTQEANRAEVDRLVEVVDLFVWVVDPQKYADAALHDTYLRRFAGHGAVTIVVLNQIDRLSADDRNACLADLTRLVAADGLQGVRVAPVSAVTGEGIEALRRELSARVAERQALVRRIDADLDWVASDLSVAVGDHFADRVPERAEAALVDAATDAAGGDEVARAVDGSYRHRSAVAVGWPPVRWIRRVKADPLARLGLGTKAATSVSQSSEGLTVRRTAISASPVAQGRLGEAMRSLSREVTTGLAEVPRAAVETVVSAAERDLPDALDGAAGVTDLHIDAPRWWTVAGAAQRLVSLAMLVGVLWLLALFVIGWFRLPDPPLPRLGSVPLPTVLALGGALIGVVIAAVGRKLAAAGGRRRAAKARASLAAEVADVVRTRVIAPINSELAALTRLAATIRKVAR